MHRSDRIQTPECARSVYSFDLALISVFVFCLLVARACIQSVTIDEADAFMSFATLGGGLIWYPAAQNHVLYTMLERLSWNIFGFNEVAMRAPALLGAAIYLVSSIRICTRFEGRFFRLPIFVCLVLNPFVLDYLVAARGYGMAVALLLAATSVFWDSVDLAVAHGNVPLWRCALVPVLLALSCAANFSFTIVDVVAVLIFLSGAVASDTFPQRRILPMAIWGTLPGVAVGLFICVSTLIGWPSGEFVYGAHSLHEMRVSVFNNLFPQPNPEIVNPLIYGAWAWMRLPLCLVAGGLLCIQLAVVVVIRQFREAMELRPSLIFATSLSAIAVFAVALHWAAFRAFGLYLPKGRTALFFVPILTLIFAVCADLLRRERRFRRYAIPGITILAACSIYYLSAFRLHYFQEWRFNEDTKNVFWVMRDVERRCGIHDFSTEWQYASILNFYRLEYGNWTMKPFAGVFKESFPKDKGSYVFNYPDGESFLKKNALAVWYHNEETGATVAVRSCDANGSGS